MTDIQKRVVQDLIDKYEGEQLQDALQKVLGDGWEQVLADAGIEIMEV